MGRSIERPDGDDRRGDYIDCIVGEIEGVMPLANDGDVKYNVDGLG
jgi:hypothetical protein